MNAENRRRPIPYRWIVWPLVFSLALIGAGPRGVAGQETGTILTAGWNNVLYTGPPGPIQAILSPLAGQVNEVTIWDGAGQIWHSYFSDAPQSNDLQTLLPGQAYWVSMQSPGLLPAGAASPAPAQLLPGWNNVAYFGPGAPGSSILEQTSVWAWNPNSQRWRHRDPSSPTTSDLQSLTPFSVYWVYVSSGSGQEPSSPPPTPGPRGNGCYPFTSLQPAIADVDDALEAAGLGRTPSDPQLAASPERGGSPDGGTQPAYVPPTLLRAIAWMESHWHQATWGTDRGQSGPTLTSSACAYGLAQIVSGMSVSGAPTLLQQEIGTDFRANAEAAVQLLVQKWNRDASILPYVGRHDPHVVEDWYFATWAFHCFGSACSGYGAHDDPDDPSLPWPRPAYNSPGQLASSTALDFSDYPYEEVVYGLIANPPAVDGHSLWRPIPVQLPAHGSVGFPDPRSIGEPSAHLDDGTSLYTESAPSTSDGSPSVPDLSPPVPALGSSGR